MGGGIGMGNTCKPMAVSFQCMTKFTSNKTKKLNNKKVNWESPGSPVVKTLCFHYKGHRFNEQRYHKPSDKAKKREKKKEASYERLYIA